MNPLSIILFCKKHWELIAAALIATALAIAINRHCAKCYDEGVAATEVKYAEQRLQADEKAKEQRAADQQKEAAHSRELQAVRNEFDKFRANLPPPKTLVQVKEVKVSEQVTCPVVSLSHDFWLSYNAAANLQAGESKTD